MSMTTGPTRRDVLAQPASIAAAALMHLTLRQVCRLAGSAASLLECPANYNYN